MHSLPVRIVDHRASGALELAWDDGVAARLPYDYLRKHCRCAECEGARRAGGGGAVAAGCVVEAIETVAAGGLRLTFDDGHARGIYPWPYLHSLAAAHGATAP
jgi:DUF971 family protein